MADNYETKCCQSRHSGSTVYSVSIHIYSLTLTKSYFKIYSKVCCGGNLYYKHIWKCEKTKNGEIAVKLSWKEKKKHWTTEYIGKHFFQNTARVSTATETLASSKYVWTPLNKAEYLSLITIKGMHMPDDADYSKRLEVLEDQVAPGGRQKIGYFDPKFKTLSNNHG